MYYGREGILFGSAIVIHEAATPFFRVFFQNPLLIQRMFFVIKKMKEAGLLVILVAPGR